KDNGAANRLTVQIGYSCCEGGVGLASPHIETAANRWNDRVTTRSRRWSRDSWRIGGKDRRTGRGIRRHVRSRGPILRNDVVGNSIVSDYTGTKCELVLIATERRRRCGGVSTGVDLPVKPRQTN